MEFVQRKPNRLCEYDYSRNGAYFVTICTQNRKELLSDIVGDGFPVPFVHPNHIMDRKTGRILSLNDTKKDAVCNFIRWRLAANKNQSSRLE